MASWEMRAQELQQTARPLRRMVRILDAANRTAAVIQASAKGSFKVRGGYLPSCFSLAIRCKKSICSGF